MNTLKRWRQGEYVLRENDPNDSAVFIGGYRRQPRVVVAVSSGYRWWRSHSSMISDTLQILAIVTAVVIGVFLGRS